MISFANAQGPVKIRLVLSRVILIISSLNIVTNSNRYLCKRVHGKFTPGKLLPGRLPPTLTLTMTLTPTQDEFVEGKYPWGKFFRHDTKGDKYSSFIKVVPANVHL